MHSIIVTTTTYCIAWYGGSMFHIHAIYDGAIDPVEHDVFTHYADDQGGGHTPTSALEVMLERVNENSVL